MYMKRYKKGRKVTFKDRNGRTIHGEIVDRAIVKRKTVKVYVLDEQNKVRSFNSVKELKKA